MPLLEGNAEIDKPFRGGGGTEWTITRPTIQPIFANDMREQASSEPGSFYHLEQAARARSRISMVE
jgi:hypothetical protein